MLVSVTLNTNERQLNLNLGRSAPEILSFLDINLNECIKLKFNLHIHCHLTWSVACLTYLLIRLLLNLHATFFQRVIIVEHEEKNRPKHTVTDEITLQLVIVGCETRDQINGQRVLCAKRNGKKLEFLGDDLSVIVMQMSTIKKQFKLSQCTQQ